jgi:hypothetical protein
MQIGIWGGRVKGLFQIKVRAASDVRFQQKRIQSRDGVENASAVALPRALGQADLDEDGTPDLIVGYEQAGSGLIEIRRGNPHYSSYSVADSHAGADGTPDPFAVTDAMLPVAESPDFLAVYNAEFNRAFVLTEYIGYLRRNPNDTPEPTLDYSGYDFWLGKLNQFNGNYIAAEMVKAFISSDEYRHRFGQ